MFCDLIGSAALSERLDPEDLRQVMRTYQACVATTIQQFDGFIPRYVGVQTCDTSRIIAAVDPGKRRGRVAQARCR
jgi:class 3 adenylate cyclase